MSSELIPVQQKYLFTDHCIQRDNWFVFRLKLPRTGLSRIERDALPQGQRSEIRKLLWYHSFVISDNLLCHRRHHFWNHDNFCASGGCLCYMPWGTLRTIAAILPTVFSDWFSWVQVSYLGSNCTNIFLGCKQQWMRSHLDNDFVPIIISDRPY